MLEAGSGRVEGRCAPGQRYVCIIPVGRAEGSAIDSGKIAGFYTFMPGFTHVSTRLKGDSETKRGT